MNNLNTLYAAQGDGIRAIAANGEFGASDHVLFVDNTEAGITIEVVPAVVRAGSGVGRIVAGPAMNNVTVTLDGAAITLGANAALIFISIGGKYAVLAQA